MAATGQERAISKRSARTNGQGLNDLFMTETAVGAAANISMGGGNDTSIYGAMSSVEGTINFNGGAADAAAVDPAAVTVPEIISATVVSVATDIQITAMFSAIGALWVDRGGLIAHLQC